MQLQSRRTWLLAASAGLYSSRSVPAASPERVIIGTYDDQRLWAIKTLTFPRVLVYQADGGLVERDAWPKDLAAVKDTAGDAFCCVSDKPAPPGWSGPPPDCKISVYGEDINEHFDGLRTAAGIPITRASLPTHRFLVVEYYASWCAPCKPAREALNSFFQQPMSRSFTAVVVDFSRRVPGNRPRAA